MTRISTAQMVSQSIDLITQRQAEIGELQKQIATGNKLLNPSDDPAAASQVERSRSEVARLDVESRMIGFAQLKLAQAESATGDGIDIFQRSRELLLAANNDTNSPEDRAMYAQELRGLRDEMFSIANRSDGMGGYIFGGAGTRQEPFVEGAAGIEFRADAGVQVTGSDQSFMTSVDGRHLFGTSTGLGNEAIFDIMDRAIDTLEDPGIANDALHDVVNDTLDSIDEAMNRFSGVRATLGEQMAAAERALESIANGEALASERIAELGGVDMAEAISALTAKQTEMDAAMQTYAQISGLSLFNYIR